MSVVEMPVNLLGAIAKFAYPDVNRQHLNGVLIDASEVVACDGHRLVRVEIGVGPFDGSDTEGHVRYLLPLETARAAVAAAKEVRARRLRLSCVDGAIRIEARDVDGKVFFALEARTWDVKYPPIDQIMIATRDGEPPAILFNPRLLEDLAPVMDACDVSGLEIAGWGNSMSPMQFAATGIRFVVMPMRTR